MTTTKTKKPRRESSRGPYSENSKAIALALAAYLRLSPDQRPHGTKKRICDRYGIPPQSFTSALNRHETQERVEASKRIARVNEGLQFLRYVSTP